MTAKLFAQVLPMKPQPESILTTTAQPDPGHGKWNNSGGTRKELEKAAKKLRKQVKRDSAIWERYVKAMKAR